MAETPAADYFIDYRERTNWEMQKSEFHESFEIFFALTDGVRCFVDDELYLVKRGDVFVFHPHVLHRTVVPENVRYKRYVIGFDPGWITDFIPSAAELLEVFKSSGSHRRAVVSLGENETEELLELVRKAEQYERLKVFRQDMHRKLVFAEILLYICAAFSSAKPAKSSPNDTDQPGMSLVAQYIRENLTSDLSLENISSHFYMSKSYLCSLFKQHTGYTVNEYVVSSRILKARELLPRNLPVKEVCEMTGFNDYSHFIRTFTHMTGISPKQYAKQHSKNFDRRLGKTGPKAY